MVLGILMVIILIMVGMVVVLFGVFFSLCFEVRVRMVKVKFVDSMFYY